MIIPQQHKQTISKRLNQLFYGLDDYLWNLGLKDTEADLLAKKIQIRKKKYVRDRSVKYQIRDRGIAICQLVHKYRLVNSDQVIAIMGHSRQTILRHLNGLFHRGYLDRVKYEGCSWNDPMIYGLGNKGADKLTEKFGVVFPKNKCDRKNREVKEKHIKHTLETSEFLISMQVACRNCSGSQS